MERQRVWNYVKVVIEYRIFGQAKKTSVGIYNGTIGQAFDKADRYIQMVFGEEDSFELRRMYIAEKR